MRLLEHTHQIHRHLQVLMYVIAVYLVHVSWSDLSLKWQPNKRVLRAPSGQRRRLRLSEPKQYAWWCDQLAAMCRCCCHAATLVAWTLWWPGWTWVLVCTCMCTSITVLLATTCIVLLASIVQGEKRSRFTVAKLVTLAQFPQSKGQYCNTTMYYKYVQVVLYSYNIKCCTMIGQFLRAQINHNGHATAKLTFRHERLTIHNKVSSFSLKPETWNPKLPKWKETKKNCFPSHSTHFQTFSWL